MVTIELEHYCFECNSPLEAEVTGNAVLVKLCERCANLRELNAATEAIKREPQSEGVEPKEGREEVEQGSQRMVQTTLSLEELMQELYALKSMIKDLKT